MQQFLAFTKSVLIVVVLTLALQTLLLQSFEVHGESMEPNFVDGERVIIDKLSPNIINYNAVRLSFSYEIPAQKMNSLSNALSASRASEL